MSTGLIILFLQYAADAIGLVEGTGFTAHAYVDNLKIDDQAGSTLRN